MRFIVFAMLIGCVLAASVDRVRRDDGDEGSNESDNLEMRVRRAESYMEPKECPARLWDNGLVCYSITDSLPASLRSILLKVFARFEEVSCVKFEEGSSAACEGIEVTTVELVEKTAGCWAHIGCSTQQTSINMDPNCAYFGVVAHEVFHTLGRYHEQSRKDRDDYITVNWDNILDDKRGNYRKCSNEPPYVPYDLQSIMHYGDQFFTKGGETMTIKSEEDANFQKLMGSQEKLSPGDIATINKMYQCSMPADVKCKHGGVEIQDGKCICVAPFIGTTCQDVDETKGVLMSVEETDFDASPDHPNKYPPNTDLYVVLECPENKHVKLHFQVFKVEQYGAGCGYDWIKVFPKVGQIYGVKQCGTDLDDKTIQSESNYITLKFYTNESWEYEGYQDKITCVA